MCQNNCGSGLISNTNLGADWVFYKTKIKETLNENSKEIKEKQKRKRKTRENKKRNRGTPLCT